MSEPLEVKLAWYVSRYRKPASAAVLLAAGGLILWLLGLAADEPHNFVECQEKAARTARSNAAMQVLLSACSSRFR
ncbi:hypothetical protein C2U70_30210 [Bradyrhizobium guangdongense]|nr:hypothetical protein C2U70_30210 [Bradyrhizobium guangdongense]